MKLINIEFDSLREGSSDSLSSANLPLPFPHYFQAGFAVDVDPPRRRERQRLLLVI